MSTTFSSYFYIDLQKHEAQGGHAIGRHVAITDTAMRQRLQNTKNKEATKFTDLPTAEAAVNAAIQANLVAFNAWRAPPTQAQQNFDHDIGMTIGAGYRTDQSSHIHATGPLTKVRVIVSKRLAQPWIVLTAYPVL